MSTEDDQFEIAAVTRMTFPDETGLRRGAHGDGVVLLQRYLDRFGWSAVADGDFGPKTESALRRFQAFHGLAATGVLDEPTVERMGTPRCGNPDIPRVNVLGFVLEGSRWDRTDLRYAFENFTDDLSRGDIRGAVIGAFAAWSSVTRLTFTEVAPDEAPDLRLRWGPATTATATATSSTASAGRTHTPSTHRRAASTSTTTSRGPSRPAGSSWGRTCRRSRPTRSAMRSGSTIARWATPSCDRTSCRCAASAGCTPTTSRGSSRSTARPSAVGVSLGGGLTSGPAACPTGNGTMTVFARGEDNAIWFARGSTGGFGDWTSIGGGLTSGPAACSPQPGRIDVFARGEDNAMWHTWFDGGWHDWVSRGGGFTSGPAACSTGNGTMTVFARGEDNAIWFARGSTGGFGDWTSIGGGLTSGPAACSPQPGRIDVFARGEDNAMWHTWFDGGWHDWVSRGGGFTSGPAACSPSPGRVDVFARGEDNAIWHNFGPQWYGWTSLGGGLTSDPGACSPPPSGSTSSPAARTTRSGTRGRRASAGAGRPDPIRRQAKQAGPPGR